MSLAYPADTAEGGLQFFAGWLGARYARSVTLESPSCAEGIGRVTLTVGRRWSLAVTLVDTLAADADLPFETARAAVERRLDLLGRPLALWVPRGAALPASEPGLSDLALAVESANQLEDGRLEVRRPVRLNLRRAGTTGSVVTVLGGLSAHWAQFTNRVPGTYQLNSLALNRLPQSEDERTALAERIVLASQQPMADEDQTILAEDVWTATPLNGRSCVFGSPRPENDETSAALRRNLRGLLRAAGAAPAGADATALVILGAATYAEDERLTWALKGMDPRVYLGYDLVVVMADGVVKPLVLPGRAALPWDGPLPVS
ncbi:MAG: hypothetical protein ACKVVT_15780 [Dehalococcoidia bacterium]